MRELTDSPRDTQLKHEKALLLSTQDPSHHATPPLWFWYILEYAGIHFGVGICWYIQWYLKQIKKFQQSNTPLIHQHWFVVLMTFINP